MDLSPVSRLQDHSLLRAYRIHSGRKRAYRKFADCVHSPVPDAGQLLAIAS
jgi:hypothetical protein